MKIAALLATTSLGVACAQAASAATTSSSIAGSATITSVCTMTSTGMAFGEVALTGITPATATVNVNCTNGGAYTIGLNDGLQNVAAQRYLKSGTKLLAYNLYKESAYTNRWGDAAEEVVTGVGTALQQALTVYGRISSGQTLRSGNGTPYTDTVQVILTY